MDLRNHRAVFTQDNVHPLEEPLDEALLNRARLSTAFMQRFGRLPPSPQLDTVSHLEKLIVHQLMRWMTIASRLRLVFSEADKLAIRRFFAGLQSSEDAKKTALWFLKERGTTDLERKRIKTMLEDVGAECIISSLDLVLSDLRSPRSEFLFDELPY